MLTAIAFTIDGYKESRHHPFLDHSLPLIQSESLIQDTPFIFANETRFPSKTNKDETMLESLNMIEIMVMLIALSSKTASAAPHVKSWLAKDWVLPPASWVIQDPLSQDLTPGSFLNLTCVLDAPRRPGFSSFQWIKRTDRGRQEIKSSDRILIETVKLQRSNFGRFFITSLIIQDVRESDEGSYYCQFDDGNEKHEAQSKEANIRIAMPPVIHTPIRFYSVDFGKTVTLECNGQSSIHSLIEFPIHF